MMIIFEGILTCFDFETYFWLKCTTEAENDLYHGLRGKKNIMSSSGEKSVGLILFDMYGGGVSQKSRMLGYFQVALCRNQKSCRVAISSNRH